MPPTPEQWSVPYNGIEHVALQLTQAKLERDNSSVYPGKKN